MVPGGQSVYVLPDGTLGSTPAHCDFSPEGSRFEGFNAIAPDSPYNPGSLTFDGADFLACPTNGTSGPYQVFVNTDGISDSDVPCSLWECISFVGATFRNTNDSASAWQYQ